jgi:hypothetical protein
MQLDDQDGQGGGLYPFDSLTSLFNGLANVYANARIGNDGGVLILIGLCLIVHTERERGYILYGKNILHSGNQDADNLTDEWRTC